MDSGTRIKMKWEIDQRDGSAFCLVWHTGANSGKVDWA